MKQVEDLQPSGMAVAEAFAGALAEKRHTMAEGTLDPDGVAELMANGLLVRDRRTNGLPKTVSLTHAGVLAIARYWLIDTTGPHN